MWLKMYKFVNNNYLTAVVLTWPITRMTREDLKLSSSPEPTPGRWEQEQQGQPHSLRYRLTARTSRRVRVSSAHTCRQADVLATL